MKAMAELLLTSTQLLSTCLVSQNLTLYRDIFYNLQEKFPIVALDQSHHPKVSPLHHRMMARSNRDIRQYGSSKRFTPSKSFFNMQDRKRIKGELRPKGKPTSSYGQAMDTSYAYDSGNAINIHRVKDLSDDVEAMEVRHVSNLSDALFHTHSLTIPK